MDIVAHAVDKYRSDVEQFRQMAMSIDVPWTVFFYTTGPDKGEAVDETEEIKERMDRLVPDARMLKRVPRIAVVVQFVVFCWAWTEQQNAARVRRTRSASAIVVKKKPTDTHPYKISKDKHPRYYTAADLGLKHDDGKVAKTAENDQILEKLQQDFKELVHKKDPEKDPDEAFKKQLASAKRRRQKVTEGTTADLIELRVDDSIDALLDAQAALGLRLPLVSNKFFKDHRAIFSVGGIVAAMCIALIKKNAEWKILRKFEKTAKQKLKKRKRASKRHSDDVKDFRDAGEAVEDLESSLKTIFEKHTKNSEATAKLRMDLYRWESRPLARHLPAGCFINDAGEPRNKPDEIARAIAFYRRHGKSRELPQRNLLGSLFSLRTGASLLKFAVLAVLSLSSTWRRMKTQCEEVDCYDRPAAGRRHCAKHNTGTPE